MNKAKPFWIAATLMVCVITAGVAFQKPYVSVEERHLEDRNQLLRIILEDQVKDINTFRNKTESTSFVSGIKLLESDELEGLTIPDAIDGVPIKVITNEEIDVKSQPLYSTIVINVHGSRGDVTISHSWSFGEVTMDSGLTLYCSRKNNVWSVDYGRGWVP